MDDQWQREGEAGIKNKLEYLFQSYYEASQWKMEVKDLQCEFDSVLWRYWSVYRVKRGHMVAPK